MRRSNFDWGSYILVIIFTVIAFVGGVALGPVLHQRLGIKPLFTSAFFYTDSSGTTTANVEAANASPSALPPASTNFEYLADDSITYGIRVVRTEKNKYIRDLLYLVEVRCHSDEGKRCKTDYTRFRTLYSSGRLTNMMAPIASNPDGTTIMPPEVSEFTNGGTSTGYITVTPKEGETFVGFTAVK